MQKDSNLYWDNASKLLVQGGSLKTWSFASPSVDSVQLRLWTEGRPFDAAVDLWQGPDNTPQRIRVYLEDGKKRPFSSLMLAPRGPNTVAVRNMGQMEFPFITLVIKIITRIIVTNKKRNNNVMKTSQSCDTNKCIRPTQLKG